MPGDVERVTFRPDLLFANVELQQGRLLLPADLNEQSAIHHYFLRSFIVDLVGPRWSAGTSFTIGVDAAAQLKITIAAGHYYVDGIMCENQADCPYGSQPFAPTPDDPSKFPAVDPDGALYLDCWERQVTYLNCPSLRDPALGGADTATRIQIAWQIRLISKSTVVDQTGDITAALQTRLAALDPANTEGKKALQTAIKAVKKANDDFAKGAAFANAAAVVNTLDEARPLLAADARQDIEDPDPCAVSGDLEYRGRENQLYRVEIHRPGLAAPAGQATFKWSRENASVAFKVVDIDVDMKAQVTRVTLDSLGRDRGTGLCDQDWVELSDDDSEFRRQALPLLQVKQIDSQRRMVTLNGPAAPLNLNRNAILRRWDHFADDKAEGAVIVLESKDDTGWIDLERGVKVRFSPGGLYRNGDYWLIPARAATGDIEWPTEGNIRLAREPDGIIRHRAVLGTIKKDAGGNWTAVPGGCQQKPLCPG